MGPIAVLEAWRQTDSLDKSSLFPLKLVNVLVLLRRLWRTLTEVLCESNTSRGDFRMMLFFSSTERHLTHLHPGNSSTDYRLKFTVWFKSQHLTALQFHMASWRLSVGIDTTPVYFISNKNFSLLWKCPNNRVYQCYGLSLLLFAFLYAEMNTLFWRTEHVIVYSTHRHLLDFVVKTSNLCDAGFPHTITYMHTDCFMLTNSVARKIWQILKNKCKLT